MAILVTGGAGFIGGAQKKRRFYLVFRAKSLYLQPRSQTMNNFSINNAWWWRSQFSVVSDSPHAVVER